MPPTLFPLSPPCHGRTVVRAAFVLALFGWGVGFYGPPVFLHAVLERTGWPLSLVSAALTCHFLFGAGVAASLPAIHRRIGIPAATVAGAVLLAAGVLGWAAAAAPWQLFVAAMCTGAGWVPMGAAGIHAIVSPWFAATRPLALAKAYNGASVGGMVFTPLWVLLIDRAGFPAAATLVGLAMVSVVLSIASRELACVPAGQVPATVPAPLLRASGAVAVRTTLWRDRSFVTLAAAMALGLFAQIGLISQLFSWLAAGLGTRQAGWTMGLATGCGMAGRFAMAWLLTRWADRRRAAATSYAVQATGTLLLWWAGMEHPALLACGAVLFGLGIGNATSLPPLIAQAEFAPADVPRVVARSVALSQALYAFAPAALAGLVAAGPHAGPSAATGYGACFFVIVVLQASAAVVVVSAPAPRPAALAAPV
ncbi:MAG: MFS transporter [Variovorax paradoxus]|nr:MAG: MFS transporter [Variovorax paradoxus]PZQ07106.1 MAG: MFS transporter [Variovorax paradoxus]